MTPQDLKDFRARMGWTLKELARRLDLSSSRLQDYEAGQTRSTPPRPAPIPKVVELALRQLERETRPLTIDEKIGVLRDTRHLPQHKGPRLDVSRAGFYGPTRGVVEPGRGRARR